MDLIRHYLDINTLRSATFIIIRTNTKYFFWTSVYNSRKWLNKHANVVVCLYFLFWTVSIRTLPLEVHSCVSATVLGPRDFNHVRRFVKIFIRFDDIRREMLSNHIAIAHRGHGEREHLKSLDQPLDGNAAFSSQFAHRRLTGLITFKLEFGRFKARCERNRKG